VNVTKPVRSVLIIAVVVLALVAGAVVAVLALSPGESHFAPGSPEAAFQQYLDAYESRDFRSAYDFFSAATQRQMSVDEYVSRARLSGNAPFDENQRILIGRVEHHDSAVTLHLAIEHVSGTGLQIDRSSYEQTVPLVQEQGAWKIDELLLGIYPLPPEVTR
jgi:hypothetical protein